MKFKVDNELKQIIKHLVKESLIEVLAESRLEQLVEEKMKSKYSVAEAFASPPTAQPQSYRPSVADIMSPQPQSQYTPTSDYNPQVLLEQRRRKMVDQLGISDAEWNTVYADTAGSDNSVLSTDRGHSSMANPNPEYVPENVMEAMGLMNVDFSAHIDNGRNTTQKVHSQQDADSYQEAAAKRAEMLKKNISVK